MENALATFHEEHPDVKFVVKVFEADALLEELKAGRIDLALLGEPYKSHSKFHVLKLYTERYNIVVSETHPLAKCDLVTDDELMKYNFVSREHCYYSRLFESEKFPSPTQTHSVLRTDRDDWALEAISAGLGFGVMTEAQARRAHLTLKPMEDARFVSSVDAIIVRGRQHSPAFGAFVRDARKFNWS